MEAKHEGWQVEPWAFGHHRLSRDNDSSGQSFILFRKGEIKDIIELLEKVLYEHS